MTLDGVAEELFFDVLLAVDGTLISVWVTERPGYPETNLPSTALCPASDVDFGEMVMTPLPVV